MAIETDLAKLEVQERTIWFAGFDENVAWQMGTMMRSAAFERQLPLAIEIASANRVFFSAALPGSAADNAAWVKRKFNSVMRFGKSTYRIGLEHKLKGAVFDQMRGVDPLNYAAAGGGFPIHVTNAGLVGAVTVSGIPQRQDHGFVVEMLCRFLKLDHTELMLPAE
jgi:uncharacterized protein (UPF0303 family)